MMRTHRNILLASGLAALAIAAAGTASAAPFGSAGTVVKEAADASVLLVAQQNRRAKRRTPAAGYPGPGYYAPGPGYYPPGLGYDNVGSIVYDGIGYGYNRRTGERYLTCQIDEGYGRVTPCDSGNGGGGGLN